MTRARADLGWLTLLGVVLVAGPVLAGTIETDFLQRPWPRQVVRDLEVGRYEVRWRQRASARDGIFAGVRFEVPLAQDIVWDRANDYRDIGQMTPGVSAVRFLEQQPTRQVIQLDIKVLWKTLQLTFEVEQEPPTVIRFRLVNEALGEYRGVCVLEPHPHSEGDQPHVEKTAMELATWLKPARPVPAGLILFVERMTLLQGVKEFLESCEQPN